MTAAVLKFTSWTAASSRLGVIPQAHDTLSGKFADSVVVESPLPDPLVPIVQWIFQRPGWVMALGIIAGAIVAVGVLVVLWRRRRPIITWVMTRHRTLALALAATAATVLLDVLKSVSFQQGSMFR